MTDNIEIDLVDKLRLWASTEPSHVIDDLHKAADEIECTRKELAYWRDMAITLGDYMANVPQPILDAYSAIWKEKYAKKAAND